MSCVLKKYSCSGYLKKYNFPCLHNLSYITDREVHLCRWRTPYLNTYIVGEGIYVERGRIQWLGKDPNFDCTIRVANLDLRDAGTWVCEIGSSTKESFQVQTKEFVIDIESMYTIWVLKLCLKVLVF